MTETTKRNVRFVTIEPGRISLHGIALTENEYAVLRGIAERMKAQSSADGRERHGATLNQSAEVSAC